MRILAMDLKTTSVDPDTCMPIELGVVLWDTARKTPLEMLNLMVSIEGDLSPEITEVTGILAADLREFGVSEEIAKALYCKMARRADMIIGHNVLKFDRPVMNRWCEGNPQYQRGQHWIDSRYDVPYPESIKTRKLTYLMAEHGMLNPFAHRAVFDALSCCLLLARYDLNDVLEASRSPFVRVEAQVSYRDRQKAKDAGFFWDADNKAWYLEGRALVLDKLTNCWDFNVNRKVLCE